MGRVLSMSLVGQDLMPPLELLMAARGLMAEESGGAPYLRRELVSKRPAGRGGQLLRVELSSGLAVALRVEEQRERFSDVLRWRAMDLVRAADERHDLFQRLPGTGAPPHTHMH